MRHTNTRMLNPTDIFRGYVSFYVLFLMHFIFLFGEIMKNSAETCFLHILIFRYVGPKIDVETSI